MISRRGVEEGIEECVKHMMMKNMGRVGGGRRERQKKRKGLHEVEGENAEERKKRDKMRGKKREDRMKWRMKEKEYEQMRK